MNVAQWLNAIDLGQYEALFREHEIDAGVLPDLVEADLEKIGMPLGHRKRLMRAIAALSAGGTPPSAAKPASAQPSPSAPTSGAEAERRPITVMFCDLVGSTSLAAKLDAEDWRNLVNAYLDEASAAVTGLGGHVLKKLGDGLMALFGYPQRAGERRRARGARRARDPARARRTQRQERRQGRARNFSAHRPGVRAGGGRRGRRSVRRGTERRGAGAGGGRTGLHPHYCEPYNGRPPGCLSRRSGRACAQGRSSAGDALSHRARERRWPPVRSKSV